VSSTPHPWRNSNQGGSVCQQPGSTQYYSIRVWGIETCLGRIGEFSSELQTESSICCIRRGSEESRPSRARIGSLPSLTVCDSLASSPERVRCVHALTVLTRDDAPFGGAWPAPVPLYPHKALHCRTFPSDREGEVAPTHPTSPSWDLRRPQERGREKRGKRNYPRNIPFHFLRNISLLFLLVVPAALRYQLR
jgi:hypothetical protein